MPISLTVDHENRRVTGVATGSVSMTDMAHYMAERVRLDAYSYPQLLDMRNCVIDLAAGESLYARAMEARTEVGAGAIPRTAIIAHPGTATFGFARQLATQLGFAKAAIEVFANREDAETWLVAGVKQQHE